MKVIPRVATVRQALLLSGGTIMIAIFLKLFGPIVAVLLLMIAAVSFMYAAVAAWAPEFMKD